MVVPGISGAAQKISSSLPKQKSVGFGLIAWPEAITISDSNNQSVEATAQFYAPLVNYTQRTYRSRDGFSYEAYGFFGYADIGSSENIVYFQRRVPVFGFGGSAGWFFRPESKQVNVGFSLPVQYRHASWTSPPGGSVGNKDTFSIWGSLDARWRLTRTLELNQRIGGFLGSKNTLWNISLAWTL